MWTYTSEALENDKVGVADNRMVITVTDFMTQISGRFPVDLILIDTDGDVLGSFSFNLKNTVIKILDDGIEVCDEM